jgi:hypothetical protein
MTTETVTREQFATAVLERSSGVWPVNNNNLDALVAQQLAEGSHAEFNPDDTEEGGEPGETDYNSAGVKDYPNMAEGVDAMYRTLTNGDYPQIEDALARGNSAQNVANAWAQSKWGTENFDHILVEVEANRATYYNQLVDGTEPLTSGPVDGPTPTTEQPPLTNPAFLENVAAATFALQNSIDKLGSLPINNAEALADDLSYATFQATTAIQKVKAAQEQL